MDASSDSTPLHPPHFEVANDEAPVETGRPAAPDCPRAWVVSADMGLGHLRAAFPLTELTPDGVIHAGDPEVTSEAEFKLWTRMRRAYETFSRARKIPIIGPPLYSVLHRIENISPYYPRRDLSRPTLQVKLQSRFLNKGMGQDLVRYLQDHEDLPLISAFYTPALAADMAGYEKVYLIVTDTDINRVWVPEDPAGSRIVYLCPCGYARNRLLEYGVPDERIILTGFPLPRECVGRDMGILRRDMGRRLQVLDPNERFWVVHRVEAEHYLGTENCRRRGDHPLTLMFAVGGAGAQVDIALTILESLREKLLARRIRYWLSAGVRPEVAKAFTDGIHELGLEEVFGPDGSVNVLVGEDHTDYFRRFNQALRQTDLLWTKPSELSFYAGLGIPLILAPPIGPHEEINRKWLYEISAGIDQEDPAYTDEWLFDLVGRGVYARTGMEGFLYARSQGTYKIEEVIRTGWMEHAVSPLDR